MILQNKCFASKALVIIQDYLESNMLFHKCIIDTGLHLANETSLETLQLC